MDDAFLMHSTGSWSLSGAMTTTNELVESKQNGIEFPFDPCVFVFTVCQGLRCLTDGFPYGKVAPTLYFDSSTLSQSSSLGQNHFKLDLVPERVAVLSFEITYLKLLVSFNR